MRFLVATVDVQKTAFVVQINGFTDTGDLVVVDPEPEEKAAQKAKAHEEAQKVKAELVDLSKVESDARMEGRQMVMVLAPR